MFSSQSGYTALMMASQQGETDVVDILLSVGATNEIKNQVSSYIGLDIGTIFFSNDTELKDTINSHYIYIP